MVISGFLLYDKLLVIDDEHERLIVVKKQVFRILQVYLIWSVPYLIYSVLRWDFSTITLKFVLWKIQRGVFGSTFHTIWFMPALAIGTLLSFFIVEKLPKWVVILLAVCAYAVGALNSTYSFLVSDYPWYDRMHSFISVWLNGDRGQFLFGFPLVTVGYFIAANKNKARPILSGVLSFVCMGGLLTEGLILRRFVGHTGIDLTIFMIPTTIFITAFLISLPLPWFTGCVWMRRMSVLIFMSQRLFLTVLPNVSSTINRLYESQMISFAIVCGGTISLSALIIAASAEWKCLKALY